MAKVILHGELKQFGDKFDLMVESAGEAMRALFCQIDGFQRFVADNQFFVKVSEKDVDSNALEAEFNRHLSALDEIHLVPVIAGAGKAGSLVLGVALIATAILMPASIGIMGAVLSSSTVMMAGIGLVLGGVAQLMTKTPEYGDSKNTASPRSTSFSSLSNTTAQGSCVPVAYGEIMIGSKVISQAIKSYKLSGDIAKEPAGIISSSRHYSVPTPYQNFNLDVNDDSVIARNYKVSR